MRRAAARAAIVVVALVVAVAILEVAARLLPSDAGTAPRARPLTPLYANLRDPALGYRLRPGASFRAVKGFSPEDVCYDVVYTFDDAGRRVVGPPAEGRPALALFGDSFAFGEGIADGDTLQARLGERWAVSSYATPGYGPQHVLAKIETGELERELAAGTVGLYLMPPFHLARAAAHSDQSWLFTSPYYRLHENGRPERRGSFWTGRWATTKLYWEFERLRRRSRLLSRTGLRLPPWSSDGEVDLVAAMLVEAARGYRARLGAPLVVAFHPWWGREGALARLARLRARLPAGEPAQIDASDLPVSAEDVLRPGCDEHPSAHLSRRLAERLLAGLEGLGLPAAGG